MSGRRATGSSARPPSVALAEARGLSAIGSSSRSRRSATCDTARTRIRTAAWYRAMRSRLPDAGARRCDDSSGQGALVHEPARPRRRRAHRRSSSTSRPPWSSSTRTRAAPPPATRPPTPTCARATPTASRHSAASSALNRPIDVATAEAIVSTFIEAVHRAGGRRRRARRPRAKAEHARRDRGLRRAAGAAGVDLRSILGAMLVQERDVVSEAQRPWTAGARCRRACAS